MWGKNNSNKSAADKTLSINLLSNFFDKIVITLNNYKIEKFENPGAATYCNKSLQLHIGGNDTVTTIQQFVSLIALLVNSKENEPVVSTLS